MNGSVFKRCRCTENTRKNETARTARSCRKEHGSWYFVHDLPAVGGDRSQVKRGGYPTKEEAENALAKSLAKYAQRGIAAERDLASGRQAVADYLRGWIESKKGLKPSTKRSYRTHIENHLIPLLGTVRLDELGVGHIDAAYDRLREPVPVPATRPRQKPKAPPCALTIRKDGTPRLRPGELRAQVLACLRSRPGTQFAPHA